MTTTHVVTLSDHHRLPHVTRQIDGLRRWAPETTHHLIRLDGADGKKLALAGARNAAGDQAADNGADLIIFLDADCIPGPDLVNHYRSCLNTHPAAVAAGPVTYLARPGAAGYDLAQLTGQTDPHPARPNPRPGQNPVATHQEYLLFWSLSFAVRAQTWREIRARTGGFDERYVGYGGEDTDFALRLRHAGIPLRWAGGAHAYHQWHPVSSPPWEHLDEILVNARHFHSTWGFWPMSGWLTEFARAGAIDADHNRI